jgi:hypothetical protein
MSPRVRRTLPTVEPILLTPRADPFDDPAQRLDLEVIVATRKADAYRPQEGVVQDQEPDVYPGGRDAGSCSRGGDRRSAESSA